MRRVGIFPTFGSVPTVLTFRHRARFANSRSSNPRQEHGCSLTVSESRHSGASSGLWSGPSVVYLSNPADVDLWSPVVDPVDLQSLQKPVWSVCVWSPKLLCFFLGDEKHWKPRTSNFEFRAHHPSTESGLFSSIESKSNKRYWKKNLWINCKFYLLFVVSKTCKSVCILSLSIKFNEQVYNKQ